MSPTEAAERSLARLDADPQPGVWLERLPRARVIAAAREVEDRLARGAVLPLAGRTVAVKGNIDVAGLRTTAGCPSFGEVAVTTAPSVRALEAAGAIVVGTTNLDQFATGLVGTRSPHGACPNPGWPELISGGSSSGSAVAVATGVVDIGVGTDTAGSGRVPAAATGIVGVKPTRGRVSTSGVVPACASLDCVSFFATSVDLAATAADLAAGDDPADPWSRRAGTVPPMLGGPLRIGVPDDASLHLDGAVGPELLRRAFEQLAQTTGAELVEVDLAPFVAAGRLLYDGAFVAERYAAVGEFVTGGSPDLDPVVARIITAAGTLPAWRLARDRTELARLRKLTAPAWRTMDLLAVPTVSGLPTRAAVAADPVATNTALGHYTNFTNLLDLCAIALPVGGHLPGHPPVSVTLLGRAWSDARLAAVGRALARDVSEEVRSAQRKR